MTAPAGAIWDSGGYAGRKATYVPVTVVVKELAAGASVASPKGGYRLTMQTAGAAVVTSTTDGRVLWSTQTTVAGSHFAAQSDGNVVVYSPGGPTGLDCRGSPHPVRVWCSRTTGTW